MALWMDDHAEPKTENEQVDIDAIAALKESAAIELKEQGNQYVKMGKKYYSDAIDGYTRAINQNLSGFNSSILFSNRAHVNLLLGNYRRALADAEDAISICSTNVKAYYRAAKAAFSLGLLLEATLFCRKGLEVLPTNEDMKKLGKQIEQKLEEDKNRNVQVSKALGAAKDMVCALESRHLRMGRARCHELTRVKKPRLENDILHWPVLLLYAEVMSSDFIEDFCEVDTFSAHLDMMYSDSPLLPWDKECVYTREAIELYYEAESGFVLSNKEILRHILEGTSGALSEPLEEEQDGDLLPNPRSLSGPRKLVKVDERKTLHDVLKKDDCIIPGIPVFYAVSTRSDFYKKFKSGKWTPP
ncbi:unnamed protein product [Victoria cruziana]